MQFLLALVLTTHFPLAHARAQIIPGRLHDNVVYALSDRVLYRSDDGGATFARRFAFYDDARLTLDPADDDVVYALLPTPSLQRSRDGGAHWSSVTLPTQYLVPSALFVRFPSTIIVAGTCVARQLHVESGLWISSDGGESWQNQHYGCVNALAVEPVRGGLLVNSALDIVAPSASSPLRYGFLPSGILISYNEGKSWGEISAEYVGIDTPLNSLAVDPLSGRLFVGAASGVYSSDDGISGWRRVPGTAAVESTVAVAGTTLFVTTKNGAYRAPLPAAAPFTRLGELPGVPADVRALAADPHRPLLYAVDAPGTLRRTRDRGQHWESLADVFVWPIAVDSAGDVYANGFRYDAASSAIESWQSPLSTTVSQLLADPVRRGWLYAIAGGAFFQSLDGGHTWHRQFNDSTAYTMTANGNAIYVATGRGLLVTTDGGQSWKSLAPYAHAVAAAGSTIYYAASEFSLERSDDAGATWHYVRKPTDDVVTSLVVDPLDDHSVWIIAQDGAFHSADAGATWELTGFLTTVVYDADGKALHVIGPSFSDMRGEWDATLRAERQRPARP